MTPSDSTGERTYWICYGPHGREPEHVDDHHVDLRGIPGTEERCSRCGGHTIEVQPVPSPEEHERAAAAAAEALVAHERDFAAHAKVLTTRDFWVREYDRKAARAALTAYHQSLCEGSE